MSVALFIVLDEKRPGFNTSVNGKALAKERDIDEVARKLGVRPLHEFVWMSDEEQAHVTGSKHAEPRSELVMKLGLPREPGYFYILYGTEVHRKAKNGPSEKVADVAFVRESADDWLYHIDKNGDIVRTAKHRPARPDEPFFAATEGLATVRALRTHYARLPDAKRVVDDLDEYERVLAQAAEKGFRFRLGIDL